MTGLFVFIVPGLFVFLGALLWGTTYRERSVVSDSRAADRQRVQEVLARVERAIDVIAERPTKAIPVRYVGIEDTMWLASRLVAALDVVDAARRHRDLLIRPQRFHASRCACELCFALFRFEEGRTGEGGAP